MNSIRRFAATIATLTLALALPARTAAAQRADSTRLSVFLDCSYYCDFDYIRTELTAVDWVRTRQSADVQLLVTAQQTGSGGTEFTMAFIGLGKLATMADTLHFDTAPNEASDDTRKKMLQTIRVGLVRYVARVSGYSQMSIALGPTTGDSAKAKGPIHDPWHAWVFSVSTNGSANGEELSRFSNAYTSISASRVTEQWKTLIGLNNNYSENHFTIDSVTKYTDIQRGNGADLIQVKSLTDHWSAGVHLALGSSSYLNQRLTSFVAPEIEYDVFPYKESTRRQLRIDYQVGAERFSYEDTTIYFRTAETLFPHELDVAYSSREPWGSLSLNGSWREYLNWGSKHDFSIGPSVSLNLFKGFQFSVSGFYAQLRDQIYLPLSGYTAEEALTRQRQLQTGYQYFMFFGLSYSFGSIYNNVVNPRFGSSSGGGTTIYISN